ncbi:gamma-secretase-activating protein-like [Amphiura filiformis]|uniref:gamma-secretase-activating protein-like n=1 Tax=Amphiura filiformis TaxID=82378 RepID=UPI003B2194E0
MLELTCCFDLEKDIAQVVRSQRDPAVRKVKPDESITIKIVGQERYDELLYVWNDISPITKEGPEVTLIGLYEPAKQKLSILFIHELVLDVINCSVNQELTMIAYVVRNNSTIPCPKGSESYIYRAYLAEIQPQHRIFDLNVERSTLLRVQFLWNRRSADRDTSSASRDSRLLFFLHKESIGLYQLSLARMGDKRVVMSGPPETTSLMKKFIWAQWDASNQRLFVVFIKAKQGDDRIPPVLRCLEFKSSISSPYAKTMDLTLPFPIYLDGTQEGYCDIGMNRVISDKALNMEVILQSGGSLCICYQHPVKKHTHFQSHQDTHKSHSEETVDISYSVLAVHHMKVLYGSALQVPWDRAVNTKLYFSSMAGYILVYAPGLLLHLLNVSPDVEPCLHIAIPQADIPTTPITSDKDIGAQSQNLTHFSRERTASLSGGCIFNGSSGRAYRVNLNKERIPHFLDDGMSQSLKIAIIHLVLVHLRDQTLLKKIMEPILAKPTSLELKEMIAEILVGSTFSTIRRQIERDEALLLPFTNTDPGRSQFVEAPDGERLASFKSSTFKMGAQDSITKRDMKDRRMSVDGSSNFWEMLDQRVRSLVVMGKPHPRFNTKSLRIGLHEKKEPSQSNRGRAVTEPIFPAPAKPKSPGLSSSPSSPSLFKKVAASARKVMSSRNSKKHIKAREEDFRILEETSHSAPDDIQEQLMEMTMDSLSNHMKVFMPSASNDKLLNIASEYVTCQLQQSKSLIMAMMNATGFPNPRNRHNLKVSLLTAPPEQGREMFQLVEQYFMAVQQLSYPLPPGFYTLFTIAGFRCLDRLMFLQYLDYGVLLTTEEFVSRLLKDVPDDSKENVEIKYEIITRLPRHTALQVLERWDHPISTRFLAQQYVADTLKDDTGRDYSSLNYAGQQRRESSEIEEDEDSIAGSFPPLSTLMKLLESKDPHVIIRSNKGLQEDAPQNVNIEPRFVEKVALQNTVRDYGRENLKDISF